MSTETLQREETITKPPTRWRNKYRAVRTHKVLEGNVYVKGQVHWGLGVWPSKDVAESQAAEASRNPRYSIGCGYSEYLGAFPVEEAP